MPANRVGVAERGVNRTALVPEWERALDVCAEQQRELGVLGHPRLDEDRRPRRVDAGGQPVEQHVRCVAEREGRGQAKRVRHPAAQQDQRHDEHDGRAADGDRPRRHLI